MSDSEPPLVTLESLTKQHDRSDFDSGCEVLDGFLRTNAGQQMRKGKAATIVASPNSREIAGFVTVVSSEVHHPNWVEPVLRIARLATAKKWAGRGLGTELVAEAMRRARQMRELAGCGALVVDAKTCSNSPSFYSKLGFEVPENAQHDASGETVFMTIRVQK